MLRFADWGFSGAARHTGRSAGWYVLSGLPVLLLVVLIVTGGTGAEAFLSGKSARTVTPVAVRVEDLVMTVDAEGELAAVRATELGPPPLKDIWDYKISFMVPESTRVKKGQPVLGFDAQQLQKSLDEKKAEYAEASKQLERREIELAMQIQDQELELAEAEAKLIKARLKTEIPGELKERISVLLSALDLQGAEGEVAKLKAKLEGTRAVGEADLRSLHSRRDRAKARVEELESSIEAMTVKAPQDGVVIYKTGWRDEKKKVGDSTWVSEKILEIPDLTEMKAQAQVDEADAGQVAVGQKVTLRLEARPDLDFTGRVRIIGSTVSRKSWRVPTKVYKIEVALERTDPKLMRPAMRFRGEIETGRIPSLLTAPREAIFLRPSGPVAWVKRGSRYTEMPVRIGRSNKRLVEVVSGLSKADLISPVDLRRLEPRRSQGPLSAGA